MKKFFTSMLAVIATVSMGSAFAESDELAKLTPATEQVAREEVAVPAESEQEVAVIVEEDAPTAE